MIKQEMKKILICTADFNGKLKVFEEPMGRAFYDQYDLNSSNYRAKILGCENITLKKGACYGIIDDKALCYLNYKAEDFLEKDRETLIEALKNCGDVSSGKYMEKEVKFKVYGITCPENYNWTYSWDDSVCNDFRDKFTKDGQYGVLNYFYLYRIVLDESEPDIISGDEVKNGNFEIINIE